MKRTLILAAASNIVLPASFVLPAFAQYSPYVPPSWYDYGIMRQQIINGETVERQTDNDQEPVDQSFDSDELNNDSQSEPDLIRAEENPPFSPEESDSALQAYRQAVTEEGLPANDPATAIAFFVVANYMVATGQNGDISNQADQAIHSQFRQALDQDAQFQAATAEEKQLLVETLGAMGATIYLSALTAQEQGDTQTQTMLRQFAQSNLESFFNTSLSNIHLTESGIVIQQTSKMGEPDSSFLAQALNPHVQSDVNSV